MLVSGVGMVYGYLSWVGPIALTVVRPFLSSWTKALSIQSYDPFLCLNKGHPSIVVRNINAFNGKVTIQKAELTFNVKQWKCLPVTIDTVDIDARSSGHSATLAPPSIPSVAIPFVVRNVRIATPEPWKMAISPLTIKGQGQTVWVWSHHAPKPVLIAKARVTTCRHSASVSLDLLRHASTHRTNAPRAEKATHQNSPSHATQQAMIWPISGHIKYQTGHDTGRGQSWSTRIDVLYDGDPLAVHQWSCIPLHDARPQWHVQGTLDAKNGGKAKATFTHGHIKVNGQWHGQWRDDVLHWTTKATCPNAALSTACLHQFWTKKSSAQEWTLSNIKKGQLRNASFNATGTWVPNTLDMSTMTACFSLNRVCVTAMPNLDDICDVTTDLTWTMANTMHRLLFTIDRGQLGPQQVKGTVTIDPAMPDSLLTLDLSIHGPVSDMVRRIQNIKSFPLTMANSPHNSTALLRGTLPLCAKESMIKKMTMSLSVTTPKETIYLDHNKPFIMANATVNAHIADQKVTVKGANHTYGCPVTWSWADQKLVWDAHVDPKPMDRWAFPIRVSHPVHVHGLYDGTHLTANADLTRHTLAIPWIQWSKNKSMPMHMSFRHHVASNTSKLCVNSRNACITGHCTRSSSGIMTTCDVDGRLDDTMVAYRYTPHSTTSPKTHRLFVRMPTCVVPDTWMPLVKRFASSKPPAQPGHGSHAVHPTSTTHTGTPYMIHVDVACDTLHTPHYALNDVRIQGTGSAYEPVNRPWTLTQWTWNEGYCMADHVPNNKKQHTEAIYLFMEPVPETQSTAIWGTAYHFSPLWSMIKIKNLYSQMAHINAVRHADQSITGTLDIGPYYAQIPLLGRLLSVVSPSLWTQNFHTKGILFSKTTLDFTYRHQTIDIVKLLSHGYSVGIFCAGKIDFFNQTMTLDGVIVPEYMMNTLFQYVPVIGWLLGGQQGILSSQFSFHGSLTNPKLSLDPLSIFKVGFLKNILV